MKAVYLILSVVLVLVLITFGITYYAIHKHKQKVINNVTIEVTTDLSPEDLFREEINKNDINLTDLSSMFDEI